MKAILLLLVSSLALANDAPPPSNPEVIARLEAIASRSARTPSDTPKFAFTGNLSLEHPASLDEAVMGMPDVALVDKTKTVVVTADPDTAWVSAHLGEYSGCAKDACGKQQPDTWLRATALFERVNGTWQPTAWAITPSIPSSSQQDAMEDKIAPDKLARDIAGAEDAVKVFESTIGDPKQFSATFSDRKEAVMFGSELPERYVGAKAKAQLAAWGFSFAVRDGVRAGVSKSGNIAWVAANVDAKSKKLAKTFPFRVFVLYEKIATTWKIVQLQFSTAV